MVVFLFKDSQGLRVIYQNKTKHKKTTCSDFKPYSPAKVVLSKHMGFKSLLLKWLYYLKQVYRVRKLGFKPTD